MYYSCSNHGLGSCWLGKRACAWFPTCRTQACIAFRQYRYGTCVCTACWCPAVAETGVIPPGNAPGETRWQSRSVARATKPEIRLTAGKPIQGITVEGLIDRIVKENRVRAGDKEAVGVRMWVRRQLVGGSVGGGERGGGIGEGRGLLVRVRRDGWEACRRRLPYERYRNALSCATPELCRSAPPDPDHVVPQPALDLQTVRLTRTCLLRKCSTHVTDVVFPRRLWPSSRALGSSRSAASPPACCPSSPPSKPTSRCDI